MAQHPTTHAAEDAKPATTETKADKAADRPVNLEMLVAMLATDWLHGDKHHYDAVHEMTTRLLTQLGEDGAAARARLEAAPGLVAPMPAPTPARAA
jgi:hypothetical protein